MIQRQVCELQGVSTNFWITPRILGEKVTDLVSLKLRVSLNLGLRYKILSVFTNIVKSEKIVLY